MGAVQRIRMLLIRIRKRNKKRPEAAKTVLRLRPGAIWHRLLRVALQVYRETEVPVLQANADSTFTGILQAFTGFIGIGCGLYRLYR